MAAFIVTPYVTNYEWLALSKVSALHVRIRLDVCTCTFYISNSTPACVSRCSELHSVFHFGKQTSM